MVSIETADMTADMMHDMREAETIEANFFGIFISLVVYIGW